MRLHYLIYNLGAEEGYNTMLESHPVALRTLQQLGNLRHIRKLVTDEQQLARIILALQKDSQ